MMSVLTSLYIMKSWCTECLKYSLYSNVIADPIFQENRFYGQCSKIENHAFFDHKILSFIFMVFSKLLKRSLEDQF